MEINVDTHSVIYIHIYARKESIIDSSTVTFFVMCFRTSHNNTGGAWHVHIQRQHNKLDLRGETQSWAASRDTMDAQLRGNSRFRTANPADTYFIFLGYPNRTTDNQMKFLNKLQAYFPKFSCYFWQISTWCNVVEFFRSCFIIRLTILTPKTEIIFLNTM